LKNHEKTLFKAYSMFGQVQEAELKSKETKKDPPIELEWKI